VRVFLVVSLSVVGLVVPGSVGARGAVTQPLIATVGSVTSPDAFQISLTDSTGAKVTHVDPGPYTITVRDFSTLHDFHLTGPGVDQATDVETTAQTIWNVSFTDGTYRFLCDAHPTVMRGSFTSGTVTTPPPVKKLVAQVGPKSAIILKTPAGAYSITVKDLTKSDNFHLIAPGVNRKTGVKFRGTTTWKATLRAGKGAYRSDAHQRLRGSFLVVAASS
jgi:hypothetical protein